MIAHNDVENPLLASALGYAARGWLVLPIHSWRSGACTCGNPKCASPAKHPRNARGLTDATADTGIILEWWSRWPDSNVAIRTDGFIVVDVDPRHDGDGTLGALERQHGPLPHTVRANTGGGGQHYFFRGSTKSVNGVWPGIDIKSTAGYVLVEPSVHASGGGYFWDLGGHPEDTEIAPAPAWILEEVAGERVSVTKLKVIPEAIVEGGRDNVLASIAGKLRHVGLGADDIAHSLRKFNLERCRPPLEERDIRRIAGIGDRYAAGSELVPAELTQPPSSLRPEEIVRAWASEGPVVRVATGFPSLDEACRGGFAVPWRVYLVGAPSAGKTAFFMCLARQVARTTPMHVGILAVDEEGNDLAVRMAQMDGYTVDECERRDPALMVRLAAALSAYPRLHFYDTPSLPIEVAMDDLAKRCKADGVRGLFICDSAQSVRCLATDGAKDGRSRIDANVAAIRAKGTEHRLLTIVTSEANRGSYRNDDAIETSNDMAAGKESSGIEFSAQTLIMVRTPKGHPDHVRVSVPKNRRGKRAQFDLFLRFDRDRHTLTECPDPTDESVAELKPEDKVLDGLMAAPPEAWLTLNAVQRESTVRRGEVRPALEVLVRWGRVERRTQMTRGGTTYVYRATRHGAS